MSILEQKNIATQKLNELGLNKTTLKRDVFFIPGWTSECCAAWLQPCSSENISMKKWLEKTTTNWEEKVHFVVFTEEESRACRSFVEFAKILKGKTAPFITKDSKVDLVGHSMGGLDISAAIIHDLIPTGNVGNLITLGSPFHGSEFGEVMKEIGGMSWLFLGGWAAARGLMLLKGYSFYHIEQLQNMNPKGRLILDFNCKENRLKLLHSADKVFTFFGTDDNVVKQSALFNGFGIDSNLLAEKLEPICVDGATHSGVLGLPQDPRVVLGIMNIIAA